MPPDRRRGMNLTFRARGDIRERLKTAATISGRSISEEIERILEAHFSNQNLVTMALGGEDASEVLRPLLFFLSQLDRGGIPWRGNDQVAPLVQACVSVISDAAVRGKAIPYDEWMQRISSSYRGNFLIDEGPGPKIIAAAKFVIPAFGLGEPAPDQPAVDVEGER
jgi:hypothetical protein